MLIVDQWSRAAYNSDHVEAIYLDTSEEYADGQAIVLQLPTAGEVIIYEGKGSEAVFAVLVSRMGAGATFLASDYLPDETAE